MLVLKLRHRENIHIYYKGRLIGVGCLTPVNSDHAKINLDLPQDFFVIREEVVKANPSLRDSLAREEEAHWGTYPDGVRPSLRNPLPLSILKPETTHVPHESQP